jgi:hypothetical protein
MLRGALVFFALQKGKAMAFSDLLEGATGLRVYDFGPYF